MAKTKFVLVLLLMLVSVSCSTQPTQAEPTLAPTQIVEPVFTQSSGDLPLTEADVPRVSPEEAKAALDSGAAIVVDVRPPEAFAESHVVGAINIPLAEIEGNPAGLMLEREQWIITYCTWPNEHQSARAAYILLHNGYTRVDAMLGGFEAWLNAGYPVEP